MILITGTTLGVSDLPNNDMIDYQIENEKMNIKLKTVAKSPTCFQIYIAEDKRTEYTITDELSSKIVYFKSDDHLVKLLEDGETSNEVDIFSDAPEPEETIEVPEFEPPVVIEEPEEEPPVVEDEEVKEIEDISSESAIPLLNLEEADTELPESFLMIPNFGDDTDALKVQLENKEKVIAQKDAMIRELKESIDQAYKVQEIQLNEINEMYENKMMEAQTIIDGLESKVSTNTLDDSALSFLKFINYAQSFKGVVKEGFTESEIERMGHLTSNYHIFACGAGDSNYSMLKQIKKYIEKGTDAVIIDFTNDNFIASTFKIDSKSNHTLRLMEDIDPVSLLVDVKGTKIIPTTSFNDIVFLNIDWPYVINKINTLASGKDVILLFGNISNFNIRYTVSKLATLGKLQVFAKCSPIILSALYSDISFIPKQRVNIVALEYIDVVKSILGVLSSNFNIQAFNGDVEWNKLNL